MPGPRFRRRNNRLSRVEADRPWRPPPPAGADLTPPPTTPGTVSGNGPVLVFGDGRLASLAPGSDHRVGRAQVDICFVFDTTGSMSDKITGLVAA